MGKDDNYTERNTADDKSDREINAKNETETEVLTTRWC